MPNNQDSGEHLMLTVEDPMLKNLIVFLDDQWQAKKVAAEANRQIEKTTVELLNEIVQRFAEIDDQVGNRRKISQLQQKQLDAEEEAQALEELLNQARRRQGLTPPMEG